MSNIRIIYPTDEGGVAVVAPTDEFMADHTIQDVIARGVPSGKPYQVLTTDDIPSDRTFRNAWTYEE
jgi:hypothetical protein